MSSQGFGNSTPFKLNTSSIKTHVDSGYATSLIYRCSLQSQPTLYTTFFVCDGHLMGQIATDRLKHLRPVKLGYYQSLMDGDVWKYNSSEYPDIGTR